MKRAVVVVMLLASACSRGGSLATDEPEGTVAFRVLSERQTATYCRQAPEFVVARTEDRWIDVFDLETECQPGAEIELPAVDFSKEVAVAAWWKVEGCLGHTIETTSIRRRGDEVVVTATSSAPSGPCATAMGMLESFLALERGPLFDGTQPMRFVLNGQTLGRAEPSPASS